MKTLEEYMKENLKNGVIDHAVRCIQGPNGEIDFYIHPAGVNGDTLDLTVFGNNVSDIPCNHAAGSRPTGLTPHEGFDRRSCIYLMSPAELTIREAMSAVERSGCDVRLTDAINLLSDAKDKVADFVDDIE